MVAVVWALKPPGVVAAPLICVVHKDPFSRHLALDRLFTDFHLDHIDFLHVSVPIAPSLVLWKRRAIYGDITEEAPASTAELIAQQMAEVWL